MKSRSYPLLYLLIIILFCSTTIAQTSYQSWGLTRDNTYQQDGTGVWPQTPTIFQRTANYTTKPIIQDLDGDGLNEILITKDNQVEIYNYTRGLGLILKASYDFTTSSYSDDPFYQTPGLLDYDNDNLTEIIVFNLSHMLTLEYNGTSINLNQSSPTYLVDGAGLVFAQYPVIKCAPGNLFASNTATCVLPVRNISGTTNMCLQSYDLDNNNVSNDCSIAVVNNDPGQANTHLVDGDSDGFLEVYYRYHDTGNHDIDIILGEIDSNGNMTITTMFSHDTAGPSRFTDIIVSNLDGTLSNGMEVTHGFSSDVTNWDAYTVSAKTPFSVVDASYCTVFTCPEGEFASLNLVEASNTEYCPFSGDVYYYVRNSQNNDPGKDIDTIFCISLFTGSSTQETEVSNTVNFTIPFFIHQASLYGSTGILTSLFGIQGSTKQGIPAFTTQQWLVPVDYELTGSLDIIGVDDQSTLFYYDDNFVNQNIDINSLFFDTANCVMLGEILGLTISISDDLNNPGECHVQEVWANNTQKSIQSNTSVTTPNTYTLNYFADEEGTFPLNIRCRDDRHTAYSSRTYTVIVRNDTAICNFKGQGGGNVNYNTTLVTSQNANFLTNLDSALDDVGVRGGLFKGIIWVVLMMLVLGGIAFAGARANLNGQALMVVIVIMMTSLMIIGWYINFLGGVPLVMFALVLAAVVGFKVFSNSANVTGGG